jgi:hypothetical protein
MPYTLIFTLICVETRAKAKGAILAGACIFSLSVPIRAHPRLDSSGSTHTFSGRPIVRMLGGVEHMAPLSEENGFDMRIASEERVRGAA